MGLWVYHEMPGILTAVFELVKQNWFAKISESSEEKGPLQATDFLNL